MGAVFRLQLSKDLTTKPNNLTALERTGSMAFFTGRYALGGHNHSMPLVSTTSLPGDSTQS